MSMMENRIARQTQTDGRLPNLYSTVLALNQKQCMQARTTFRTWLRPSNSQYFCRRTYKVVWCCFSWTSWIIRSVKLFRLGSRIECLLENVNFELWRTSSYTNEAIVQEGVHSLLVVKFLSFSYPISLKNCTTWIIFNSRISVSLISFTHSEPECVLLGRKRKQNARTRNNFEIISRKSIFQIIQGHKLSWPDIHSFLTQAFPLSVRIC